MNTASFYNYHLFLQVSKVNCCAQSFSRQYADVPGSDSGSPWSPKTI